MPQTLEPLTSLRRISSFKREEREGEPADWYLMSSRGLRAAAFSLGTLQLLQGERRLL